jgi:tetratricopeptide (TPR) repeat protein
VQGQDWEPGVSALIAAARVGAPGRSAPDAITRAALARGLTPEEAVGQLQPLVESGGMVEYFARLQAAHVYRQAGRLDLAEQALTDATRAGLDPQFELERALLRVAQGRLPEADAALTYIVAHASEEPAGIPDGDDPRYWLAVVQLRLGNPAEALVTARAGLAELSADQASLRAPYQAVLGESLLALGRPADALAAFRAGQRIAPSDAELADGVRRARAALGQ